MAEHWSQNTALLKGLIAGMTGLLVVGLVLLVVGMARTAGELAPPPAGEGHIALPQGARVLEMAPSGEQLYLRIEEPGGGQAILLFDKSRKRVGRWSLEPAR
jgi:hypothetical protein